VEIVTRGPGVARVEQVLPPPDSYNFEAVYATRLNRVPWTEAHQRLEQFRSLIAARTQVPIHFTDPAARRAMNPYSPSYMRIAPTATDVNGHAVDHASAPR
jgi:hypothetical protein